MRIYSVKRYKITDKLRKAIKNYPFSMREMSKVLGFEVKNICLKNISINEYHLEKINSLLQINFNLREIKFDFTKNFGTNAFTQPIRPFRKSSTLAEFIGIMLGDGNIWKNQLKIAFDKRKIWYIEYVEELAESLFGVKFRRRIISDTNQAYLYFYNKDLIEKIIEEGLKRGDKIKKDIGIPKWIKDNKNYIRRCIRGLIDTDGCIYYCKRERQTYIKFTNFNKQLLQDFKEIMNYRGYSFAKANKNNWCLYRKEQVAKFIKEIKPLKLNGAMG